MNLVHMSDFRAHTLVSHVHCLDGAVTETWSEWEPESKVHGRG